MEESQSKRPKLRHNMRKEGDMQSDQKGGGDAKQTSDGQHLDEQYLLDLSTKLSELKGKNGTSLQAIIDSCYHHLDATDTPLTRQQMRAITILLGAAKLSNLEEWEKRKGHG